MNPNRTERRQWLRAGLSLLLPLNAVGTFFLSAAARAQAKPLRIVVPFGAGGVADQTARAVGQKMQEMTGRSVVIENKPGAGGVVAGETVARAEPDGNTLLLMSNGTAVSAGLFKSLPFDPVKDFAPVSTLGFFEIALIVADGHRFKSLAEFTQFARAQPGKLNVGTVNIGSTQNLAAELLKSGVGLDFQVIPFNGTPNLLTALRAGDIDVAVEILGPIMGQVQSKAVRVLGTFGEKRLADGGNPVLSNVPTLKESGMASVTASSWNALAATAGTPKEVIARLNKEVAAALATPDLQKRLQAVHVEPHSSTPEQLGTLLAAEIKRWSEVIVRAKIPRQ